MPLFVSFFFLLILGNVSFPGTSAFIAEMLILVGALKYNIFVHFFLLFGLILGAVYNFWFFNRIAFGNYQSDKALNYIFYYSDLNRRESTIIIILISIMFYLGIFPNIICTYLHGDYFILLK